MKTNITILYDVGAAFSLLPVILSKKNVCSMEPVIKQKCIKSKCEQSTNMGAFFPYHSLALKELYFNIWGSMELVGEVTS